MGSIMIYGATGYTGRLACEHAAARGLRPIVAGRNADAVTALANAHRLEGRAFALDDDVAAQLSGVSSVIHIAGPFSRTSAPMLAGCLAARANYIDITGEIDVFEALATSDAAARSAGIVVLPGAGFDVVPSDCLAAHVKRRLPTASALDLVIGGLAEVSRGTARTMVENIARGTMVRENCVIIALDAPPRGTADFGAGLKPTIGVSWGDVSTAYHSTGIADIRCFFEASTVLERAATMPPLMKRLLATRTGQRIVGLLIDRMPPGPDAAARAHGRAALIAHAVDAEGRQVSSQLETPEGYSFTALSAVEVARRVDKGDVAPGFHTPSTAFGPDFVLSFPGVTRRDL